MVRCEWCVVKFETFIKYFRSPTFHNFAKVALTKNPKKRPNAEKLLQVSSEKMYITRKWLLIFYVLARILSRRHAQEISN